VDPLVREHDTHSNLFTESVNEWTLMVILSIYRIGKG